MPSKPASSAACSGAHRVCDSPSERVEQQVGTKVTSRLAAASGRARSACRSCPSDGRTRRWCRGSRAGGPRRSRLPPAAFTACERGGAVGDAVADVVQALAPLLEALATGESWRGRREELDVALGDLQQRLLDAVGVARSRGARPRAERVAVVVDGGVEVVTAMATWSISVSSGSPSVELAAVSLATVLAVVRTC